MRIARVFPRKTNASPTDELCFFDAPPMLALPEIDEVHISAAFTYDMHRAAWLYWQWRQVGVPVELGGPAYNQPGGEFVPGRYLKKGFVITSRGCPNRCWFCSVPRREGYKLRELPITEGWNVLDDNLLACSEQHIRAVFAMLKRQKERVVLSGGLEARLLKPWHVELIHDVAVKRMYFAYDTPDDLEPLIEAGKILRAGGISEKSHAAACYVLIGYEGDTMDAADKRLRQTMKAGFLPYAMLYRGEDGKVNPEWARFQTSWVRPQIVGTKMREAL